MTDRPRAASTDHHDGRREPAPPSTGAASPTRDDTAFATIAPYYRWRPPYPQHLFTALVEHYGLDGSQRLLDLGCGTGHITIPIARAVDEVLALDCVPEMLAHGARRAERAGVGHRIRWLLAAATDLPALHVGTVHLAVAACSLHWMDPQEVLADLDRIITPDGGVALIDSARPADYPRPAWQIAADEVRRRWRGSGPGASPTAAAGYGQALAVSAFSDIAYREWEEPIVYSLDTVVGLQYSYADTTPAALGADQVDYEHELRHALRDVCPDARFADRRRTRAWMARRPEPPSAPSRSGAQRVNATALVRRSSPPHADTSAAHGLTSRPPASQLACDTALASGRERTP